MKKKINIDRDPISGEEIASRMNFNQLMSTFPGFIKPPFYKTGWFITTVASVAIIATVTTTLFLNNKVEEIDSSKELLSSSPPTTTTQNFSYEEDTPCVKPPVKELDIKPDSYYCNNEEGITFKHTTGSKIIIPSNTFVDVNGNKLEGEIEIRYREFHDPIDFILSGIPMTYDSADVEYTFESAGMIEIYGFQNGLPVSIAEGKSIRIELDPKDGSSRFNLYELDTIKGAWDFKGKPELVMENRDESTSELNDVIEITEIEEETKEDGIEINKSKEAYLATKSELNIVSNEIKELEKNEPIKPVTSINKDRQFLLDVDPQEFPELKNYEKLLFEVDKDDKNFSPDIYTIEWEDIALSESNKANSYYLTLFKGSAKKTFSVHPVFEGDNYKKAMVNFNNQFQAYSKELENRKEEEAKLKDKLKKQMEMYEVAVANQKKKMAEYNANMTASFELAQEQRKNQVGVQAVARAMEVTRFGTWNCDSPVSKPSGKKTYASFANNQGSELGLHHVNLIEKNKNAVFTYNENQFASFKYNPKEENTIVAFTNDNELAIIKPVYFETKPIDKKHQFKMELISVRSLSKEELKRKLNL